MTPGTTEPTLTIAMPAYDEVGNVEAVVRALVADLEGKSPAFEILIVDDGSTDGTGELVDRLAREIPRVRAIHHGRHRGIGAGLRSCVAASRGEWVFLQPADGQLPASTARRFYERRADADVVVGSRGAWRRSRGRRLLTIGFHFANRLLLGVDAAGDYGVCFMFRGDMVRSFATVSGDMGAAVLIEFLFLARRGGAKISWLPAEVMPRISGVSKVGRPRDTVATLANLLRSAVAHRVLRRARRTSTAR